MHPKKIVADSTFFIFFFGDIDSPECLNEILDYYLAHIGPTIKGEISAYINSHTEIGQKLNDMTALVNIEEILEHYAMSLLSIFPHMKKWKDKGEFEAIGLAYLLETEGNLQHLIVDDKSAHTFIEKNLEYINKKLTRTFGFLCIASTEGVLSEELVNRVVEKTEQKISYGEKPLNIGEELWNEEVKPKLSECIGVKI